MSKCRIVVVGGVAGGATAAAKARRVNELASIKIFERGSYVSFANCGIPYFIGGEIKERESLFLSSPEHFKRRYNIEVLVGHEVQSVDAANKLVRVRDLNSDRVFDEPYDKLILSPGASGIRPPWPGAASRNVVMAKTVPDADAIKAFIDGGAKRACVVGAGFIGTELAEQLHRAGLEVTVVELANQILPPFDKDVVRVMERQMRKQVSLRLGARVVSFDTEGDMATAVNLESGDSIPTDLVLLCVGVRPLTELAKSAGLEVNRGVVVSSSMLTSDPNIYAVGDSCEVEHMVTHEHGMVPLAANANKQGRVAGALAAGASPDKYTFKGTLGTAIVGAFGITAGLTGVTERKAAQLGLAASSITVHSNDHVSYYPGSHPLEIKLVTAEESGRILGAQVVGTGGVDKRVDVFATAIYGNLTCTDLQHLDLSYAPQFGSAKDPVILAGMSAQDQLNDDVEAISYADYKAMPSDTVLLDVRTEREFDQGHCPGAINIPVDDLRARLCELDATKHIVLYCAAGYRAYLGVRILRGRDFEHVYNITGGFKTISGELDAD